MPHRTDLAHPAGDGVVDDVTGRRVDEHRLEAHLLAQQLDELDLDAAADDDAAGGAVDGPQDGRVRAGDGDGGAAG
ncbi:MAG: hypothetical protein AAF353_16020 [Pseudomonadota bacterium]